MQTDLQKAYDEVREKVVLWPGAKLWSDVLPTQRVPLIKAARGLKAKALDVVLLSAGMPDNFANVIEGDLSLPPCMGVTYDTVRLYSHEVCIGPVKCFNVVLFEDGTILSVRKKPLAAWYLLGLRQRQKKNLVKRFWKQQEQKQVLERALTLLARHVREADHDILRLERETS